MGPEMRKQEGYIETSPYPSCNGCEGGEEAVHIPTDVTYVTENHFLLVTRTLKHLALCMIGCFYYFVKNSLESFLEALCARIRRGAGRGGGLGRYRPVRG